MIHFGTGGWRAIIAEDFTKRNVQLFSYALAQKMKENNQQKLCVGYDRRFLSDEAAKWVCEVLSAAGIITSIINNASPTPLVMYTVKKYNFDYGIAVTASHNPAVYNGIKLFTSNGRDADETITEDLEARIENIWDMNAIPTFDYETALKEGKIIPINPLNEYIDTILESIDTQAIRKKNLKVVLDPMYGVSKTSLSTVLITARCDVSIIHERHDALFGGQLPAPTSATLNTLRNTVLEEHCDIGIATDGDADRIGIIDDTARFLHPNKILVLLYYYLLKYKHWTGCAVRNIATTHLLDRVAKMYGQVCYEVPVGFKHISAKMGETNALIGGESSGGLTVRGHIEGKDGIYAAALLVEMIAVTGKSLSRLYKEITDIVGSLEMAESDFRFSQEKKTQIYHTLFEEKQIPDFGIEIKKVSYLDGCKIYFENRGWIIARFSGTEPLLRIFCEMASMQQAEKMCRIFAQFLNLNI